MLQSIFNFNTSSSLSLQLPYCTTVVLGICLLWGCTAIIKVEGHKGDNGDSNTTTNTTFKILQFPDKVDDIMEIRYIASACAIAAGNLDVELTLVPNVPDSYLLKACLLFESLATALPGNANSVNKIKVRVQRLRNPTIEAPADHEKALYGGVDITDRKLEDFAEFNPTEDDNDEHYYHFILIASNWKHLWETHNQHDDAVLKRLLHKNHPNGIKQLVAILAAGGFNTKLSGKPASEVVQRLEDVAANTDYTILVNNRCFAKDRKSSLSPSDPALATFKSWVMPSHRGDGSSRPIGEELLEAGEDDELRFFSRQIHKATNSNHAPEVSQREYLERFPDSPQAELSKRATGEEEGKGKEGQSLPIGEIPLDDVQDLLRKAHEEAKKSCGKKSENSATTKKPPEEDTTTLIGPKLINYCEWLIKHLDSDPAPSPSDQTLSYLSTRVLPKLSHLAELHVEVADLVQTAAVLAAIDSACLSEIHPAFDSIRRVIANAAFKHITTPIGRLEKLENIFQLVPAKPVLNETGRPIIQQSILKEKEEVKSSPPPSPNSSKKPQMVEMKTHGGTSWTLKEIPFHEAAFLLSKI